MKRILLNICTILLLLNITSCTKDLMLYEGQEGVYFGVQWGPAHGDSTVWAYQSYTPVEFINLPSRETTVKLRVMTTGKTKDYDRNIQIRINPDSTTAVENVDYKPIQINHIIPANHSYVDIPIEVLCSDDLNKEPQQIGIELIPNEHFVLSVPKWYPLAPHWASEGDKIFNAAFHTIKLSNTIVRPNGWWGQANNGREAGLFGYFTPKKYYLICEFLDLTYEDFLNTTVMSLSKAQVINQVMKDYLQSNYDAGTPILEDDGRLMFVSGVTWTSDLGVPYKP